MPARQQGRLERRVHLLLLLLRLSIKEREKRKEEEKRGQTRRTANYILAAGEPSTPHRSSRRLHSGSSPSIDSQRESSSEQIAPLLPRQQETERQIERVASRLSLSFLERRTPIARQRERETDLRQEGRTVGSRIRRTTVEPKRFWTERQHNHEN